MKILVATSKTQGQRANDFTFVPVGEPVFWGTECDREDIDGGCGCKRSLNGVVSQKATTTFEVVDRQGMDRSGMMETVLDFLMRGGWIKTPAARRSFVRAVAFDVDLMTDKLEDFPVGTVLERRGGEFKVRRP